MTTTVTKNFLGIPIEGNINEADKRTPQKPLSELEPLIRAVLDDPTIKAFGWQQYTPYFNDGDACVFRSGEPWFRTTADPDWKDEDHDYDDYYVSEYGGHPSIGKRPYEWKGEWPNRNKVYGAYEGPDEARYERCLALSRAIDSGAYDDVLLQAFGDHAQVVVTATGITVDFYSHD